MKLKIAVCTFCTMLLAGCVVGRLEVQNEPHKFPIAAEAININAADAAELQRIPDIGEKLAADIIEFRQKHGSFRRPEHLLLINGISDRRFRALRHLVRVD